ncbi:unnamed protein product [Rotaria sp. Silwood1]|nr:unnamed protein product [Rotaria sp. Silwood1]
MIILTGDWNAKVGNDNTDWEHVMGKHGYGTRNERGERLLEFAAEHDLFICNTRFQQKPRRKWTWASLDGVYKTVIDLVMVQRRPYFKLHGHKHAPTDEIASTRRFYRGRTETSRTCIPEVVAWCRAMINSNSQLTVKFIFLLIGGSGNFIPSVSCIGFTITVGGTAPICFNGYGVFYRLGSDAITFVVAAY